MCTQVNMPPLLILINAITLNLVPVKEGNKHCLFLLQRQQFAIAEIFHIAHPVSD